MPTCFSSSSLRSRLALSLIVAVSTLWMTLPAFAVGGGSSGRGDFLVGTCARDITPVSPSLAGAYEAAFGGTAVVNHSDPIYVAGFGNDRAATGYNDQLWARGVVLSRQGHRVAIVSLAIFNWLQVRVGGIASSFSRASERFIQALLYVEAVPSAAPDRGEEVADGNLLPARG